MKKNISICIIVLLLFISSYKNIYAEENDQYKQYTAVVTEIEEDAKNDGIIYHIQAKFKNGPYKNKLIKFDHIPIENTQSDIELRKGMTIIVSLYLVDGKIERADLSDVYRIDTIKVLAITFMVFLIIFGGFKGLRSAFSLILTFLLIIFCLIPLLLNNYNPILATVITSSIAIFINFLLISGFSSKSFCAIISTIGGTIVAGLCAYYFGNYMSLTGLADEHVQNLVAYTNISIDYRGLLFSGIIIGTIGAVMDVGMSITSFIFEIKNKHPHTSQLSLFRSGLTVGKDIMSTMTNTLILAYAGASLPLLLFFVTMDASFIDSINMEFISEEILRSLCGSIGLILTIPISSFMASIKA
ncbi:YibE/F family protein [Brassicibacter mesophilus]|uniref:YibE/F family protein n=1 Tax=Brassicibacter mesophilus TaxID=745119 RepID=UPI003D2395BA